MTTIFKGLDRAVSNQQWVNLYIDARMKNFLIVVSNHSLMFLRIDSRKREGMYPPYRFEAKWLLQDSYMEQVQQLGETIVKAHFLFHWKRKLKFSKRKLNNEEIFITTLLPLMEN